MEKNSKITVFGGTGMLGGAIVRRLKKQGYENISTPSRKDGLDLTVKEKVDEYFKREKPEYVFMVAGLVGGILANNSRQADFLYTNGVMILYVLEAMRNYIPDAKLLYTGSTCIYPRENPQPINEKRFMQGPLEETNKGYAVAKGMGIIACEVYRKQYNINAISVMPTNLYGQGDNYDLTSSHFIAAMVKKFLMAKKDGITPVFWGTGNPRREALYVDDCADACIYLMNNYNEPDMVNVGMGYDYSIKEFINITKNILQYDGSIEWDRTKPDGTYEKRVDITKLKNIMPEYNPRSFEQGLKDVLAADFNVTV